MSTSQETIGEARQRLAAAGQDHVLRWYETLSPPQQATLLKQVRSLDLEWLGRALSSTEHSYSPESVTPYREVIVPDTDAAADGAARQRGERALAAGQLAVLLVAGGQGTRLGFDGPKGAYPIGAISGKTLFQLHAERLIATGRRYGATPLLMVMTSPANDDATRELFAEHDHFGLEREKVIIFAQGLAPAVDEHGRLLLATHGELVMTPNGNGGLFSALASSGALDRMRDANIETLSYIQVDNALAQSTDSLFLGYHLMQESEYSCKAVAKVSPEEKVGNFARVSGKLTIVEYTEIPQELAQQRDKDGQLLFDYGNPGLFMWSREFLERQASAGLPIHKAHKKIPYVSADGDLVTPTEPSGYKLEMFALDTLPAASSSLVLACLRDAEFAPVKNADGTDSPASARALMTALYRQWLEAAGTKVATDGPIEVSPLYALEAAQIATQKPPDLIDGPTYLERQMPLNAVDFGGAGY